MATKNIIVQVDEEVFNRLKNGKKISGVTKTDLEKGVIVFNPFGKGHRKNDLIVKTLEHGWVKESSSRIKVYDSLPKGIGTSRMIKALEREMNVAAKALIDREIIDNA